MPIRRLPPETVNRIAAGEVVERPASAVKELVENAPDAGASSIEVQADGGGLGRILVADNGRGLAADQLPLAIERHATSKLGPDEMGDYDLLHILTLGFRGEALPSIGSVARLTITSRAEGEADAHSILVEGGAVGEVMPAGFPGPHGARVEVRDLFYATPARLKFMKSERSRPWLLPRRSSVRPWPMRPWPSASTWTASAPCDCPPNRRGQRSASAAVGHNGAGVFRKRPGTPPCGTG